MSKSRKNPQDVSYYVFEGIQARADRRHRMMLRILSMNNLLWILSWMFAKKMR